MVIPTLADEAVGPLADEHGFWQSTLDSLSDTIAVLDFRGEIVAVNKAWGRFAHANGGTGVGVGTSYLNVCDRASAQDAVAGNMATALRKMLSGSCEEFTCVYACHAPWQERWFTAHMAPFDGLGARRVTVTHHEITGRHQAQVRTVEQATLLDAVDAAIIATDLDGVITQWSKGAEALHGWPAAEAIGEPLAMLFLRRDDVAGPAIRHATVESGRWDGNIDLRRRDGTSFPSYVRTRLLRDDEGRPKGLTGIGVDMTESMAMEHELRNARDFLGAVTHTMPDGLIVLDRDGRITLVNEAAEEMLGWPAAELVGELEHDKIHALKSDGSAHSVEACPIALARATSASVRVEDDVFQRCDGSFMAVRYAAAPLVTQGGDMGSVVVFGDITESKAHTLTVERELDAMSWVGRIRDALGEDRIVLHAQPMIDLATGATIQHELLARMLGPTGEVIAPGRFLPVAEKYGLIQAIDRRVLELALPYAARHRVAINLSADSISEPDMYGLVRELMEFHGTDPGRVVFEITETALIDNEDVAQSFIQKVRGLGCGVALDDFGTGYGSFRYLKRLPVTLLKIDQDFVQDLDGEVSTANRHVIEAIVTLARGMGQLTIAEGVETETSLAVLRELGVDYGQGYLFARPAPAAAVFEAIEKEHSPHA